MVPAPPRIVRSQAATSACMEDAFCASSALYGATSCTAQAATSLATASIAKRPARPGNDMTIAPHLSVDGHFHHSGVRDIGKGGAQGSIERVAAVDGDCLDALAAGQCAEVDIGKAGADGALQSEMPAEFEERIVALVLDDDKGDADPELDRRPQPLDRIHAGAVAQQRDDLLARPPQRNADRRRQAVPETAAGAGVTAVADEDRQTIVPRSSAALRFLDDDAPFRAQQSDLLHQICVGHARP